MDQEKLKDLRNTLTRLLSKYEDLNTFDDFYDVTLEPPYRNAKEWVKKLSSMIDE